LKVIDTEGRIKGGLGSHLRRIGASVRDHRKKKKVGHRSSTRAAFSGGKERKEKKNEKMKHETPAASITAAVMRCSFLTT